MAMNVGGSRRRGAIATINVTPMADVMIVLLIIFMVMTPLLAVAPVKLPPTRTGKTAPEERRVILVRLDGTVTLDGFPAPGDAVTGLLAGKPGPVWVTADAGASYLEVERVLAACRRAGVEEVALEVQPPPG